MEKLIYLILILLPTYLIRFEILGLPFTGLDVLILLLFFIFVLRHRGKVHLGNYKYLVWLFLLAGTFGAIIGGGGREALGLWKAYVIEPVLFFIVFVNVRPDFKKVIKALSLAGLFIAIISIWQYFSGYGIPAPWNVRGEEFRVTSVYEYPNAVGLFLTPILLLIIGYSQKYKKKSWLMFSCLLLGLAAIFFSQTQGAILGILFGVFVLGLLSKKYRWMFLLLALVVGTILWLVPMTREIILFQDNSGQVRLALWQGTWNLLQANPLTGAGLAGFPEMYAQYKLDQHVELLLYPHNLFLDFWVEFGILGLIWIIWALGHYFLKGFWQSQKRKIILIATMAGVVFYGMVDVVYFKNDLAIIFWTLLGLMEISNTNNK